MRLEEPRHANREKVVADKIAAEWKCEWEQMGPYSPFDVYLRRGKDMLAIVEIRTRRDRECYSFPTVLLDMDKWFSLMQAEIGLGLRSLYVIAFTDGIWYVRIGRLPVREFVMSWRGRKDRPEAANDLSPVIEVPTSYFRRICDSDGVFEPSTMMKKEATEHERDTDQ